MKRLSQKPVMRSVIMLLFSFATSTAGAQNNYTASLCTPPATGPSALLLTAFSNNVSSSFLPAVPAAAGYLVIRTTTATAPTAPADGTVYTAGTNALGGYIESTGVSTSFTSSSLLPSTSYYYWVIPYNTALTCAPITYFNSLQISSTVNTLSCGALTNVVTLPETGNIAWTALVWSLGHLPTACEDVRVECTGILPVNTTVTLNINTDVSLHNLSFVNSSTASGNDKLFKINVQPGAHLNISGDLSIEGAGARVGDSVVFASPGTTTIAGNATIGLPGDNSFVSIGSSGNSTDQTIIFKGDVTYNQKAAVSDKNTLIIMAGSGAQLLVNNTSYAATGKLLLYDKLQIGNGTAMPTVTLSGTNGAAYLNNNGGSLHIYPGATLALPQAHTLNADNNGGSYNSSVIIDSNGTLKLGGDNGGYSGNNFTAHYTSYSVDAGSTIEYNGSNAMTQTIYNGIDYGKLIVSNGNGTGRAAKITTGGVLANTSLNVNGLTDLSLGSSLICQGACAVLSTGGLYCAANVVSGTGSFTLNSGAYLGIGHTQGITAGAFATGNIRMAGGRSFSTGANYIYNGSSAQITGTGLPASCNDLTIDNPATVTIAAGETVNGTQYLKQGVYDIGNTHETVNNGFNVTAGKMKANTGILEFKNSSGTAQNISGSWFVNRNISTLINSNTTGITLSATANDTLNISSAFLFDASVTSSVITANNNLTFLSRDTATARLGEITGGNSITGNVTVERYIGSGRRWNQLAWPVVSSQTAQQSWMENNSANGNNSPGYGLIMTDAGAAWSANGFDSRSLSGPTVKYYNPSTNNYTPVPNTTSYAMNTQSAYFVYVRGDRSCTPSNSTLSPTILRATGNIQTGNKTFNADANVFTAIGNPYPSAVDLRKVDTLNLISTFYIWDPKLTGIWGLGGFQTIYQSGSTYKVLPGGGSYGAAGSFVDTLESGQAFFVHAKASAGTITFKENAKTIGARNMARDAVATPAVFALLSLVDAGGNTLVDGTMASFDPLGNNGLDYEDAPKMANTNENVSFKRNGQLLAVERRHQVVQDDTLFLNISGCRVHQYQWEITPEYFADQQLTGILIDNFSGTATPLSMSNTTTFMFDVTAAAASSAPNRFMIVFKPAVILPVDFTSVSASRNTDKTITVKWNVENEINMDHYQIDRSADGIIFHPLNPVFNVQPVANNGTAAHYSMKDMSPLAADNYYRVKAVSNNGQVQYSAVVKVGPGTKDASLTVYPNPVTAGNVNLRFENQPKGNYTVNITNNTGQSMHTETVQADNNNFVRIINLDNKPAPGSYRATIINGSGKITTIPFIVE